MIQNMYIDIHGSKIHEHNVVLHCGVYCYSRGWLLLLLLLPYLGYVPLLEEGEGFAHLQLTSQL